MYVWLSFSQFLSTSLNLVRFLCFSKLTFALHKLYIGPYFDSHWFSKWPVEVLHTKGRKCCLLNNDLLNMTTKLND